MGSEFLAWPEPMRVVWREGEGQGSGEGIAANQKEMVRVRVDGAEREIAIAQILEVGGFNLGDLVEIAAKDNNWNGKKSRKWTFVIRGYGPSKGQMAAMIKINTRSNSFLLSELRKVGGEAAIVVVDYAGQVEKLNRELSETEDVFVRAGRATLGLYRELGDALIAAKADPEIGAHGNWNRWLGERGIQTRRSTRAMQVARDWGKLELAASEKSVSVTQFTLTEALDVLAKKKPVEDLPPPMEFPEIQEMFAPWGEFKVNRGVKNFPFILERKGGSKSFQSLNIAVEWFSENCFEWNRLDAVARLEGEGVSGVATFAPDPAQVERLGQQLSGAALTIQTAEPKELPVLSEATISITSEVELVEPDAEHPAGVLAKSGNDEQYSPEKIWRPGLVALDVEMFDLDPASHQESRIPCRRIFTKEDNALIQSWECSSMWMNHPYSLNDVFLNKFWEEYQAGKIGKALLLTKTDNRTYWYQDLVERCVAFCLTRTGLKFENEANTGGSFFGSTVFYFGPEVDRFYYAFAPLGRVCQMLNPEMFGE